MCEHVYVSCWRMLYNLGLFSVRAMAIVRVLHVQHWNEITLTGVTINAIFRLYYVKNVFKNRNGSICHHHLLELLRNSICLSLVLEIPEVIKFCCCMFIYPTSISRSASSRLASTNTRWKDTNINMCHSQPG